MISVGYEKIEPTPAYPVGTSLNALSKFSWNSSSNLVLQFKKNLKTELRNRQAGRCCYCRRHLFDDGATHIEHFVEKSQYPEFAFEVRNLALSCGTCNTAKNGHHKTLTSKLGKRAKRQQKVPAARLPVLTSTLASGSPYPDGGSNYRWVHPHFDEYSKNIGIEKGWVFAAVSRKGLRTIQKIRLNAVSQIERRALHERMANRGGRLSLLVGALAELNSHRANEVAKVVVRELRRRRRAQSPVP